MKTYLFAALLLTCSYIASSQKSASIHVSGNAEMEVSPDIAIFNYNITASAKDYEQAINELNTRVNQLVDKLKQSGFSSQEIETSNFNISQNNIYNQGKVIGKKHIASQSIVIEFDFDESKLLAVLKKTTAAEIEANLSINFKLSDTLKKQTRDKLLRLAVQDAKGKAQLLTIATGCKLLGVNEITHSSNNNYFQPRTNLMEYKTMAMDSAPTQFDPNDLTIKEQVQITYNIE